MTLLLTIGPAFILPCRSSCAGYMGSNGLSSPSTTTSPPLIGNVMQDHTGNYSLTGSRRLAPQAVVEVGKSPLQTPYILFDSIPCACVGNVIAFFRLCFWNVNWCHVERFQ